MASYIVCMLEVGHEHHGRKHISLKNQKGDILHRGDGKTEKLNACPFVVLFVARGEELMMASSIVYKRQVEVQIMGEW